MCFCSLHGFLRDDMYISSYDFFYKNGVPKWRGTGYYYSRFRPGLGVRNVFFSFKLYVLIVFYFSPYSFS